jgi:hypothetical protein
VKAIAVALALCALLPGCGEDAPAKSPWSRAHVPGVPLASGVAIAGGWLLLSSSQEDDLFAVRRADIRDGATVEARRIPVEVDGERRLWLFDTSKSEPREFLLRPTWSTPQRISGVAVSPGERPVAYLASEAYRIVAFGPLETDAEGAPTRVLLQRAAEVPGARRTRSAASDWQDYSGDRTDNGISGVAVDRDDLLVVERGRGEREPGVWRIDRISGAYRTRVGLSLAHEKGDALWWSDVHAAEIGFVAPLVWTSAEGSGGNLLHVPKRRDAPAEESVSTALWMPLDPSKPGETIEGIAVTQSGVLAVRAATEGGSTILWRSLPATR